MNMKNYTNTAATILYMHGSLGRHTDRDAPPYPFPYPFPHLFGTVYVPSCMHVSFLLVWFECFAAVLCVATDRRPKSHSAYAVYCCYRLMLLLQQFHRYRMVHLTMRSVCEYVLFGHGVCKRQSTKSFRWYTD